MKYIIRKVIEAKNISEAIKKETKIKPLEVYLNEEEFKTASTTQRKEEIGFDQGKLSTTKIK